MGQKANPLSNRLPLTSNWRSKWFAGTVSEYRQYLVDDMKIRDFIKKRLATAGVRDVEIARSKDRMVVKVITSRPGLVIGRGGQGINTLKDDIQNKYYPGKLPVIRLEIVEERNPDASAILVAQNIGNQIEKRMPYRRAAKQALERTMSQKGVKGIKILVSGRLNGAEIARNEKFQDGTIPLSRFKYDIDYAVYHAKTTYGIVGIKVWINRGISEEAEEV